MREVSKKLTVLRRLWVPLMLCAALLVGAGFLVTAVEAAPTLQPPVTTITVDTTADLESGSLNKTCGFTQGALFFPAADGKCTFRRALVEAAARPQADRPILIQFNIPMTDTGYVTGTKGITSTPYVSGTWMLMVDDTLPPLKTDTILNKNGQVTIDGSTQPGGRSDGPPIIVNMQDYSLEVESTNNVFRHLAFYNGGALFMKEDGNLLENIWMGLTPDGMKVAFRTPGQFNRMAFGGIRFASDGNTIRNSVLTGAFGRAVDIDGGDNNIIEDNLIGTRADGTVPAVDPEIRCKVIVTDPDHPFAFYYDENDWYGGWGIAMSGSNNIVRNNRLVGMNNVRSANDTPAMALEVFGSNHQIISNTIGVDINGYDLGVCGQALKLSGPNMDVLDNVIAGASRFNPDDPNNTAIFTNDGSPLFDRVTVLRNIVRDGIIGSTDDLYEFGPAMPEALKIFRSARITTMSGTTVSGGNGVDILGGVHECPHCRIDFYLDDDDERNEALEWLGSTQSALDGSFAFTLTQPLSATQGLHTISTSTDETMAVSTTVPYADSVVFDYSAGMSFEASKLFLPMQSISVTGPITGAVGAEHTFTMEISPTYATNPFLYTIDYTDGASTLVRSTQKNPYSILIKWTTPGVKTLNIKVEDDLGSLTKTYQIEIIDPLATPTPTPTSTPNPSGTSTPTPTPTPTATPKPGTFGGDGDVYLPLVTK